MKNLSLFFVGLLILALNSSAQVIGSFKDTRDGHIYKTVTIGTQTWMDENLALKVNKGCWEYGNNNDKAGDYGFLYDWKTATTICPTGWHLPTIDEWLNFINFLGGETTSGGKLKESGTGHWVAPNIDANNSSGFTALPGGSRTFDGTIDGFGNSGSWWSASEENKTEAKGVILYNGINNVMIGPTMKGLGFSVRCLKD